MELADLVRTRLSRTRRQVTPLHLLQRADEPLDRPGHQPGHKAVQENHGGGQQDHQDQQEKQQRLVLQIVDILEGINDLQVTDHLIGGSKRGAIEENFLAG